MTEDGGLVATRRPSIATIFNPRRMKGSAGTTGAQRTTKSPHPRPSVVITDEDASPQALTLTNGGGDVLDGEGTPFDEGIGGLGAHMRERTSIISERGLGINLGSRGIGSRASSGSLNVTGIKTHPQIQHSHSTGVRHTRSPSINLGSSAPSNDPDQGVTVPAVTVPEMTVPAVTESAVTVSIVTVPTVTVPTVTVPAVTVSAVTVPAVTVSTVTVPTVTVPAVTVPAVAVPAVTVSAVTVPTITVPTVTVPTITVPTVTVPAVNVTGIGAMLLQPE
ncbi:hypothetical protein FHG87_005371 [Trinorchestia longiramus]|nr:hypothetical protein FHG87_005371 [Trinorchestia longiramus]